MLNRKAREEAARGLDVFGGLPGVGAAHQVADDNVSFLNISTIRQVHSAGSCIIKCTQSAHDQRHHPDQQGRFSRASTGSGSDSSNNSSNSSNSNHSGRHPPPPLSRSLSISVNADHQGDGDGNHQRHCLHQQQKSPDPPNLVTGVSNLNLFNSMPPPPTKEPPSPADELIATVRLENNKIKGGLATILKNYLQVQRANMGIHNNKVRGLGSSDPSDHGGHHGAEGSRSPVPRTPESPTLKENTWTGSDPPLGSLMANNTQNGGSNMLESNRVRMIRPYLNYSSIVAHAIEEFYEGRVRGKLDKNYIFFDRVIFYFVLIFSMRNLMLAFIDDVEWRGWLGETEFERPQRQMLMVYTILSVYIYMIYKTVARAPKMKNALTWLSPFQVLRGVSTAKSYSLSNEMLDRWYTFTVGLWRWYFLYALACIGNITILYLALVRHRWNSHRGEQWFNVMQIFWSAVSIIWTYIAFTLMYIHFVYFNSLCFYFTIRFEKVNKDIEVIITQRLKANERVQMLQHVLIEHNELCLKVSEYNHFWAKYLMSTYFYLISIICFTAFQAFFTSNYIYIRGAMFLTAASAAFIITRLSVSASVMSNTAHAPYNRLIRVTFEKYPIELQIQLRMFIQRTSGPTIGFYCLDIFEITYTTYASILAALGQNFLLIVDFVRSYAEVSKEYEEINLTDLGAITNSLFNSTLGVLDEMTGTDISSTITNTSLIQSIIQQK